jgi:hypothetical protein
LHARSRRAPIHQWQGAARLGRPVEDWQGDLQGRREQVRPDPEKRASTASTARRRIAGRRSHLKPELVLALQRFASCMRGHGVNLPPPSTTGGGIFDTSHLNKNSPQFKAAETQCNVLLRQAF